MGSGISFVAGVAVALVMSWLYHMLYYNYWILDYTQDVYGSEWRFCDSRGEARSFIASRLGIKRFRLYRARLVDKRGR